MHDTTACPWQKVHTPSGSEMPGATHVAMVIMTPNRAVTVTAIRPPIIGSVVAAVDSCIFL